MYAHHYENYLSRLVIYLLLLLFTCGWWDSHINIINEIMLSNAHKDLFFLCVYLQESLFYYSILLNHTSACLTCAPPSVSVTPSVQKYISIWDPAEPLVLLKIMRNIHQCGKNISIQLKQQQLYIITSDENCSVKFSIFLFL